MSEQKRVVRISIGTDVSRRGGIIMRGLAIAVLGLLGWSIRGELPNLPKFIVVGAPHTSNWDWLLVMAVAYALRVRISWMVKHTFFRWPLKKLLVWQGGVVVNRQAANDVVGESISRFEQAKEFILCITPEGTRSKVQKWKTGFYHIAQGAKVPIVPAIFDYGRKQVRFAPLFNPTGDLVTDLGTLKAVYAGVVPKNQ
jgi:1-acyl-sn-glycerol-3-phosphate acyltransferase